MSSGAALRTVTQFIRLWRPMGTTQRPTRSLRLFACVAQGPQNHTDHREPLRRSTRPHARHSSSSVLKSPTLGCVGSPPGGTQPQRCHTVTPPTVPIGPPRRAWHRPQIVQRGRSSTSPISFSSSLLAGAPCPKVGCCAVIEPGLSCALDVKSQFTALGLLCGLVLDCARSAT